VPLRLRDTTIGTLNLFRTTAGTMSRVDVEAARGLADMATIGILHERAIRESDIAREQLQNALTSRVVIEQAKGVISQLRGVDMDEAFRILREYSRSNNRALRDVADAVVRRSLTL
jgi:AmiR/NasT family two-component response regulator